MKHVKWWARALGSSLLLMACVKGDAAVKEPEAAGTRAVDAAEPAATNRHGSVPAVDVLGGAGIDAFEVRGVTARVASRAVDVGGQPFSRALRAEIKEGSPNPWDVQLVATSRSKVQSGDVLLATFWFRTEYVPLESGEAEAEVNFELNHPPFEKSMSYPARAGAKWRQILVPFVAKRDFEAGEAQLSFRLGYPPRTIDIAGVKIENFQKQLALADLPRTKSSYPGIEADAPWRAKAEERIDRWRKANLTVRVTNENGSPVPNADVTARLSRHAFNFGTAAPLGTVLANDSQQFRDVLFENFNMVTPENDLKWEAITDWDYPLERGLRGVDWLREAGFGVRCHVLVWPGWENTPAALKQLEGDRAALAAAVKAHVRDMTTALKGRCDHWDVVNEPFTNHDVLDILGHEAMVEWFSLARSIDPKPKLFINDFGILAGGGGTTAHRDHYEKMIQLLSDRNAPFDGIGLQGHFGSSLTGPDDLVAVLDRYAKFKKELAVTEFDVDIGDEELVGQYVRDFYTVLFSHPAVTTLVMWGFDDAHHWKKNAVMYRRDMTLKPSGQAYQDLVLGAWRTQATGATDTQGAFVTRGFKGQYEISVKAGDRSRTVNGVLADGGSRIDVKI